MTWSRRLIATTIALCCATAVLVACAGSSSSGGRYSTASAARSDRQVTKLMVFVVENHSLGEMRSGMPWVYRLAQRYGYTTRYDAITHPSLPNYLAMAGGQTYGIRDDASPAAHRLPGHSVFGRAIAAGSTATVYAEGMSSACRLTSAGRYAVRHNPWTYYPSERRACRTHDVPLRRLAGDIHGGRLPAVGMVVPDLCNDAHDCSLAQANAWLRTQVGRMMTGPDWRSGRLAIVITADEDDNHHGNRVLTVVAHPGLHHAVVRTPLSHYALSRSYAEVGGFAPLAYAKSSRSLLRQFGLTPAP